MNKQSHSLDVGKVLEAFTGEYSLEGLQSLRGLAVPHWTAYYPSLLTLSPRWCQGNERLPIPRQYHRGGSLEGLLSLRRGLLSLTALPLLGLGFPRAERLPIPCQYHRGGLSLSLEGLLSLEDTYVHARIKHMHAF